MTVGDTPGPHRQRGRLATPPANQSRRAEDDLKFLTGSEVAMGAFGKDLTAEQTAEPFNRMHRGSGLHSRTRGGHLSRTTLTIDSLSPGSIDGWGAYPACVVYVLAGLGASHVVEVATIVA